MNRIIVAFAHNASREKLGQMIELCGHPVYASFRSGAETLRAARKLDGVMVVCGYKLSDMTADQLIANLGPSIPVMVVASPVHLEMLESPSAKRVASPISRAVFSETLNRLAVPSESRVPQRTPEEIALIARAKALMMAQGMTEAQAHSALQQRSMRARCKLTETARQVVAAYDDSTF